MAVAIYSSKDVTIAWGGVSFEGLAPEALTLSFSTDRTSEEVGSDGQTQISIMADQTASCTINFQQGSSTNKILAGVLASQQATRTIVRANLTVSDPSGTVFAFLRNAHIKTAPEISLGADAAGKAFAWVFFVDQLILTSTPSGFVTDEEARIASAIDTILSNF